MAWFVKILSLVFHYCRKQTGTRLTPRCRDINHQLRHNSKRIWERNLNRFHFDTGQPFDPIEARAPAHNQAQRISPGFLCCNSENKTLLFICMLRLCPVASNNRMPAMFTRWTCFNPEFGAYRYLSNRSSAAVGFFDGLEDMSSQSPESLRPVWKIWKPTRRVASVFQRFTVVFLDAAASIAIGIV
jgi:hypothetical protein